MRPFLYPLAEVPGRCKEAERWEGKVQPIPALPRDHTLSLTSHRAGSWCFAPLIYNSTPQVPSQCFPLCVSLVINRQSCTAAAKE